MNLNHVCALTSVVGAIAIAGGIWLVWSLGLALIVTGVICVAGAIVLCDPPKRR